MEILDGKKIAQVFDNCYAKPPQQSDATNISVLVLFSAHGTVFCGQFHYNESEWHIHIGSLLHAGSGLKETNLPIIPDRDVEYWFHIPEFERILENTRKTERDNGRLFKMRSSSCPIDKNMSLK